LEEITRTGRPKKNKVNSNGIGEKTNLLVLLKNKKDYFRTLIQSKNEKDKKA
jgi:hypothetical protein